VHHSRRPGCPGQDFKLGRNQREKLTLRAARRKKTLIIIYILLFQTSKSLIFLRKGVVLCIHVRGVFGQPADFRRLPGEVALDDRQLCECVFVCVCVCVCVRVFVCSCV
jgi:hypothetical protein